MSHADTLSLVRPCGGVVVGSLQLPVFASLIGALSTRQRFDQTNHMRHRGPWQGEHPWEWEYFEAPSLQVWDEEAPNITGVLFGPKGDVISVIQEERQPFGYGRGAAELRSKEEMIQRLFRTTEPGEALNATSS